MAPPKKGREEPADDDNDEKAKKLARQMKAMKKQIDRFVSSMQDGSQSVREAKTAAQLANDNARIAASAACEAGTMAVKAAARAEDVRQSLKVAGIAGVKAQKSYMSARDLVKEVLGPEFDDDSASSVSDSARDHGASASNDDEDADLDQPGQERGGASGLNSSDCHASDDPFEVGDGGMMTCNRPGCTVRSHRRPACSGREGLLPHDRTWSCPDHRDEDDGAESGRTAPGSVPAAAGADKDDQEGEAPASQPQDGLPRCIQCRWGKERGILVRCGYPSCEVYIHRKKKCSEMSDLKEYWCTPAHQPKEGTPLTTLDDDEDDEDEDEEDEEHDQPSRMASDSVDEDNDDGERRAASGENDQERDGDGKEDAGVDEVSGLPREIPKTKDAALNANEKLRCYYCIKGPYKGPLTKCPKLGCPKYAHRLEPLCGPLEGGWYCVVHKGERDRALKDGEGSGGGDNREAAAPGSDREGSRRVSQRLRDVTSVEYLKVTKIDGAVGAARKPKTSSLAAGSSGTGQQGAKSLRGDAKADKIPTTAARATEAPRKTGQQRQKQNDKAATPQTKAKKRGSDDDFDGSKPRKKAKKDKAAAKGRGPPNLAFPPKPTDDFTTDDESEPPASTEQNKEDGKKSRAAASTAKIAAKHTKALLARVEKTKRLPTSPTFVTRSTRRQTTEQAEDKADEEDAKKKKNAGAAAKKKPRAP